MKLIVHVLMDISCIVKIKVKEFLKVKSVRWEEKVKYKSNKRTIK